MNTISAKARMYRMAGITAITGAISMFIGAIFWGSSGTDIWNALDTNQMGAYLGKLENVKPLLAANTSFWILGVLLMGLAGSLMVKLSDAKPAIGQVALVCIRTAVPVAIVSFICMLVPAVRLAPEASESTVAVASTIGWTGSRLDDLATVLIVGAFPFFISLAGRPDWVPRWLQIWSWFAVLAGLIAIIRLYNPALAAVAMVIIPVGLIWMIGAGIVLVRKARLVS